MLYQTLLHPHLALIFILCGLICGLIFDAGTFLKFLFANKKVPSVIIDFIQTLLCFFTLFMLNVKYNYGMFRFFPLLITLLVFSLERLTLGKIVAKFYLVCYTWFTKIIKKVWSKSKNGKANKTH